MYGSCKVQQKAQQKEGALKFRELTKVVVSPFLAASQARVVGVWSSLGQCKVFLGQCKVSLPWGLGWDEFEAKKFPLGSARMALGQLQPWGLWGALSLSRLRH